uniref:Uncharacterized protein n=1 Tax=Rhizophora mucronata TaxID=61149 RepID=A0A2P2MG12_RHIMU
MTVTGLSLCSSWSAFKLKNVQPNESSFPEQALLACGILTFLSRKSFALSTSMPASFKTFRNSLLVHNAALYRNPCKLHKLDHMGLIGKHQAFCLTNRKANIQKSIL